jgi:hypothetical protein
MDITTVISNAVATTTAEVTTVLSATIPEVLVIFGALVALGLALGLVTAYIHKKAGSRR